MKKYLQEPLMHFLLGGLILFFIHQGTQSTELGDSSTIKVDEAALIDFTQYREKAFDAARASTRLNAMTVEERKDLERDFIESEILYREALALGLDKHDSVMRSRLIQKMDYIILGVDPSALKVEQKDLKAWFDKHAEDYRLPPSVSFTHVFYRSEKRGPAAALALAKAQLPLLLNNNVPFEDARHYGERFYFHRDYIDRTPDFIASHFDNGMMTALFKPDLPLNKWQGPFVSRYGAHLIRVKQRIPSRLPSLDEVAPTVLANYERHLRVKAKKQAVAQLATRYRIER